MPRFTRSCAKSALSARAGRVRPASSSASRSSIRSTSTGFAPAVNNWCSALPEVSTKNRARVRAIFVASRAGKSSGTPGGWLPDSTTMPFSGAAFAIRSITFVTSLADQVGPGMTKRYCSPVAASVTVRLCRVSPGAGKGARPIPCSASRCMTLSPVGPPSATKAVEWPPSAEIARLTFSPPPPGSVSGRVQRSLRSGAT